MALARWVRGIAIGAGLMYLLDPERGARRRARIRDKATHTWRTAEEAAGRSLRDARNRARGVVASARSRLQGDDVDDEVLEARVRSAIGRVVSHPGAIEVSAANGQVLLSGPVLAREVDLVLRAAKSVRGVDEVLDELDVYESTEGVSALQGGPDRPRVRRGASPTGRLLTGMGGAALTLYGSRLPRMLRSPLRLAGMSLVARAVTRTPGAPRVGTSQRPGVAVNKTIHVRAPVEEVFALWSNFEKFPLFMSHLREVRRIDDLTSHWVAVGPAGTTFEWTAEITEFEENRLIAWNSLPGSSFEHEGRVRFEPTDDGGTRVHVRMAYSPPAGAIGHTVATLFGADPKRALDDDLLRFKSLLEEGKSTAHGREIHKDEVAASPMPPE